MDNNNLRVEKMEYQYVPDKDGLEGIVNIDSDKMIENDKKYLCNNNSPKSDCTTPEKVNNNAGWTGLLLLAGLSTTIGSAVPIGWTIGVLNTPSAIIKGWMNVTITSEYGVAVTESLMEVLWSALVSVFLIGGMMGSFTGACLANRIGRKSTLIVAAAINIITSIMFIAARPLCSVEILFISRFVTGLGSGLAMTVMPTYVSEIAPIELRGAVGVLCPLGVTSGVVFAQVVGLPQALGTADNWHYLLGFYGILALIGSLAFPWLPESPKYLFLIRRNKQEAIRALSDLRNLPEEFVCCELDENDDKADAGMTFSKVLSSRDLWLNISLVCAFNIGQQFSGINAVFYYSVSIFQNAGLSEQNAQFASLAAGVMNFVVAVIMIPLINVFPRRTISLTSCSLASFFLVLLCFSTTYMTEIAWLSYVSVLSVLAYVLVYGFALGPVPYFLATELFDVGPRPIAMALGTAANWIGNLSIGLFFPTIQSSIGAYSFLIFAASTLLLTIFIKTSLPETNVNVLAKRRKNSFHPSEKI